MQDEVERRLPLVEPLHELRDRHVVRGEPRRRVREHARLVGDVEMDVEAGAPRVRVEPLELAPARVVLEKAGAGGADDAHEVCNDGGGRFRPPCPRAFERDLADRVALQHDGVERAVDRRERVRALDEGGLHADVDRAVDQRGDADEAHHHAERGRRRDVRLLDLGDAARLDLRERHARAEGDRGEDRHLRGRVRAVDVVGRIGFGIAERLSLRERVGVRAAALHAREDEVRRPVDDAEDAVDVRRDERLAKHLDDRDRGADRRLEPELHTRGGRCREELGALARDQLLVRGHDRLPGLEERADVAARRLESAHHLRHHVDRRVVADRREIGRQHAVGGREGSLLRRVLHERAHDAQPVARSRARSRRRYSASIRLTEAPTVP